MVGEENKGAEGTDGFKQVLPSDVDRLLELILLHLKLRHMLDFKSSMSCSGLR